MSVTSMPDGLRQHVCQYQIDPTFCYICGQPFVDGQSVSSRPVVVYHANGRQCKRSEPVHLLCQMASNKVT